MKVVSKRWFGWLIEEIGDTVALGVYPRSSRCHYGLLSKQGGLQVKADGKLIL